MYAIVPAQPCHLRAIAPVLRSADLAEIEAFGLSPMRALMRSWRAAVIRRAAYVDGEIAAVWGVGGSLMSGEGRPWLLTSPAVERVPLAFAREARADLARMLAIFPVLWNRVPASYAQALGFLAILGFQIGNPEPFGPKGVTYCRVEMRRAV